MGNTRVTALGVGDEWAIPVQPPHQCDVRVQEGHQGRTVQVDPIKPTMKAPGTKHLKLKGDKRFQTLLSNSTCAATSRGSGTGRRRSACWRRTWTRRSRTARTPCSPVGQASGRARGRARGRGARGRRRRGGRRGRRRGGWGCPTAGCRRPWAGPHQTVSFVSFCPPFLPVYPFTLAASVQGLTSASISRL